MAFEAAFWLCIFLILFSYFVYPVLLLVINGTVIAYKNSMHMYHKTDRRLTDVTVWPTVTVIIAAFNEEKHIVDRINNLLQQDYPAEKLTIFIGSDGSTDKTVALVETLSDPRLKLFAFPFNRGKVSVLNDLISAADAEVLVFSDANTFFKPDAVKQLTRHFVDEHIAGVCGELNLFDAGGTNNHDSLYWRLERFLKFNESEVDGFLGANGAIYALRRDCCNLLPTDTIVDDFVMFMSVALDNKKIIYDASAIAEEEIVADLAGEFRRRVRIGAGNYQAFFRFPNAFHPKHKMRVFTYFCHKVLRWFTPHFMLLIIICNLFLLDQIFYQLILLIQVAFYLSTYLATNAHYQVKLPKQMALPTFFISMNFALAQGFVKYITGSMHGSWNRTER